jgi:VCBS repeat-containing protein
LGGVSSKLTVDLPPGEYLFLLNTASGITALTGYTLNVLEDHVYTVSSTTGSTTGNVMADDIIPTGVTATVTDVNGVHVNATGVTTIQGLYGSLTIDAQGNYTYTLRSGVGADKISTPDTFVYTITDSNGHKDSASLNITPTPHALDAINDVSKQVVFDTTQHIAAWSDTTVGTTTWTTALFKSTSGTGSGTFVVDPNTALHNIVLHFDIHPCCRLAGWGLAGLSRCWVHQPLLTGSFTGGSTSINLTGLDLDSGTYTLSFTGTAGALSVGGITITPSVTGTSVFLSNYETTGVIPYWGISTTGGFSGCLDQLASVNTRLSITGFDGHVSTLDPFTSSNTTATVVGHYGILTIGVDGSYTYTLNSGVSLASMNSKEIFNYTLTAANGQSDSATLTINLSPQMTSTNHNDIVTGSAYGDTLIYHVLDTTVAQEPEGMVLAITGPISQSLRGIRSISLTCWWAGTVKPLRLATTCMSPPVAITP